MAISIHVPSWGTTHCKTYLQSFLLFQSTFPRGERRYYRKARSLDKYFNPRSLVGNDFHAVDIVN